MNKIFVAIALFAAVAGALAQEGSFTIDVEDEGESQAFQAIPDDKDETLYVRKELEMMSDFCLKSRDNFKTFLSQSMHSQASRIFDAFVMSSNEVASKLLEVSQDTIAAAVKEIKDNGIGSATNSGKVDVDQIEADVNDNISKLSMIGKAKQFLSTIAKTIIEAATSELGQRIALLRAQIDTATIKDEIEDACDKLSTHVRTNFDREFRDAQKAYSRNDKLDAETKRILNEASFASVGCLTAGRIAKADKGCKLFKGVGQILLPILGVKV